MKFIRFTYIDSITLKPLTQEPASNGPSIPENVNFVFDIESTRCKQAPILYGILLNDEYMQYFMEEVSEDIFFTIFKQELKSRVFSRLKETGFKGVEHKGTTYGISKTDVDSLLTAAIEARIDTSRKVFNIVLSDFIHTLQRQDILDISKKLISKKQDNIESSITLLEMIESSRLSLMSSEEVNNLLVKVSEYELSY